MTLAISVRDLTRRFGAFTAVDGISFDVSEPGVPVLVKISYFPNWEASGADGPFRVTPNHMVVVPTDTHVELRYGWTGVDVGALGQIPLHDSPFADKARKVWPRFHAGIRHLLAGRVAERVVRTSDVPVMTIRHPD